MYIYTYMYICISILYVVIYVRTQTLYLNSKCLVSVLICFHICAFIAHSSSFVSAIVYIKPSKNKCLTKCAQDYT